MVKALRRPLLLALAWVCVALGAVGIVLPLLPTTPFLLVAIWAFSRSSPEMAARIRNHAIAGSYVRDWEDEGVIPLGAKIIAITMMLAMLGYLYFGVGAPSWVMIAASVVLVLVAAYMLSRPSRPRG